MGIALIDNSTLSSVERILGKAPVRSRALIDGDLVAFESFLNAILFYNDIIALDDYKPEFSQSRKEHFSFINFINPTEFKASQILMDSKEEAKNFYPTIKGEKMTGEFSGLLFLLNMNIHCSWDISNSIYYLTLKLLGNDYSEDKNLYDSLFSIFFSQLSEHTIDIPENANKVSLIDQYGNPINTGYRIPKAKSNGGETGGLTPALNAFIASLNWISFRSIYYSKFAEYLKADTFLHPIRQKFQISYYDKTHNFGADYITDIIDLFSKTTTQTVEEIFSSTKYRNISFELPLFLSSIISKVEEPKDIIDYALELRSKEQFVNAREQLGEIKNLLEVDFEHANIKVSKIYNSLQTTLNSIKATYGVKTRQGDSSSKTIHTINSITPTIPHCPQIPEEILSNPVIGKIISSLPKKSFSFIYKDIVNDLTEISKLGKLHDMLSKDVVVEKDAPVYTTKFQNPDFADVHSWWTSPM